MLKKMTLVMAIVFAGLFSVTSANAATFSLVGGDAGTIGADFKPGISGLTAGDATVEFPSLSAGGLLLSGASLIEFEFLGSSAGYTDLAIELGGGTTVFNENTAGLGDKVYVNLAPDGNGFLPFKFNTDSGNGSDDNAINGGLIDAGLTLAFAALSNDGKSVIAIFGDNAGDQDIDDMIVRISVVPLPPAVVLFGAALFGLGWLGRRRKII